MPSKKPWGGKIEVIEGDLKLLNVDGREMPIDWPRFIDPHT